jgi:carboxyl-terminal processing protease
MPPRPQSLGARRRALTVGLMAGAIVGGVVVTGAMAEGASPDPASDPWAHDYSTADYAERMAALDGGAFGVGLRLRIEADGLVIADVDRGSPADRAGVRAGERVVAVDGRRVKASDLHNVVRDLRRGGAAATVSGPAGTREVALAASALGSRSVIVRDLGQGVRHVRVDALVRDAADRVRDRLGRGSNAGAAGIILDLRGNGGGLVTEAVDLAGVFVDGGPGVAYARADGTLRSLDIPESADVVSAPMVVLVDGATASAAEMVAGILQDRGRAVVIGSTTFGKGTVQEPSLSPNGVVQVRTVGRYVLPSGREIDGQGITPDVVVDDQAAETAMMTVATSVLRGLAPMAKNGG